MKIYDGTKHTEVVSLTNLMEGSGDAEISDLLWFESEKLKARMMVAVSGSESNPALSILRQLNNKGAELSVIGRAASSVFSESSGGAPA